MVLNVSELVVPPYDVQLKQVLTNARDFFFFFFDGLTNSMY